GHTLATLTGCDVFIKVIDEASISHFYGTEFFVRQYYEEGLKADVDDLAISGTTGLPLESEHQEEALDLSCKQKQDSFVFDNILQGDSLDYDTHTALRRNGSNFNPIHIEPEPPPSSSEKLSSPLEQKIPASMTISPDNQRNVRTLRQSFNFNSHGASGLNKPNLENDSKYSTSPMNLQTSNEASAQFSTQRNNSFDAEQVHETVSNGPLNLAGDQQLHIERRETDDQANPSHIQEIKNYLIPLANLAVTLLRQKAQGQNNQHSADHNAVLAQAQALRMSANVASDSNAAQAEELAKQAFAAALDLTAKSQGQNVLPANATSRVQSEQSPSATVTSPNKRSAHCHTISVKDLLLQHPSKRLKTGQNLPIHVPNSEMVYQQAQPLPNLGQMNTHGLNTMIGNNMMMQPVIVGQPPGIPRDQFNPQQHQFPPPRPNPLLLNSQNQEQSEIRIERAFSLQQAALAQQQHEHLQQQNQTVRELLVQNNRHPQPATRDALPLHMVRPPLPPLIKKENIGKHKSQIVPAESSPGQNGNQADQRNETTKKRDSIANIVANIKHEPVDVVEKQVDSDQVNTVRHNSTGGASAAEDDEDDNRLYIDTGENSSIEEEMPSSNENDKNQAIQDDSGESKDSTDSSHGKADNTDDPKKRRFRCEICGKVYAKNESLKYHKMNHDNYRPHQCETCGRAFANPYTLDVHRRIHLNESDKPYRCKYCDKTFATSSHRNVHMTHHKEVKSFECSICRRRYLNKETLDAHVQRHGERRYPCDTCGMSFKALAELTEHRLIHSLPKNYPCEVCRFEFHRRNELLLHMSKAHPNTRPFECENCDKSFSTVESLRVHQRCHTGELPHKCRFCSRQFVHGKHCEVHESSHFKEKHKPMELMLANNAGAIFYQCEKCGQVFTEISHLQTHQKLHKLQEKEEALANQAGIPLPQNEIRLPKDLSSGSASIPFSTGTHNSIIIPSSVPLMNGPQISNVVSLQNISSTMTMPQNLAMITTAALPTSSAVITSTSNNNFTIENRNIVTTAPINANHAVPMNVMSPSTLVRSAPVGAPVLENMSHNEEKSKPMNLTPPHQPPPLQRQTPMTTTTLVQSNESQAVKEPRPSPSASVQLAHLAGTTTEERFV
ncbi:uncharacterized protein LOC102806249, partial [Saccoglossus kowalevskii]|uniref:Uncharacterized protein LOC102806249 n=1 Tax=Saccoglossus kowalevskii TaxID=10224 RepID=A0ABM0MPQ2_SACKO